MKQRQKRRVNGATPKRTMPLSNIPINKCKSTTKQLSQSLTIPLKLIEIQNDGYCDKL